MSFGSTERVRSQKLVSEMAERLGGVLNEANAKAILALTIDDPVPERRQHLASRANEGLLTAEEHAEYETYVQMRGLLAILQSKARLFLAQAGPA